MYVCLFVCMYVCMYLSPIKVHAMPRRTYRGWWTCAGRASSSTRSRTSPPPSTPSPQTPPSASSESRTACTRTTILLCRPGRNVKSPLLRGHFHSAPPSPLPRERKKERIKPLQTPLKHLQAIVTYILPSNLFAIPTLCLSSISQLCKHMLPHFSRLMHVRTRALTHSHALDVRYRDVAVNLRIDSEETRRRGAETHVCEVQLLLRAFADIKVG